MSDASEIKIRKNIAKGFVGKKKSSNFAVNFVNTVSIIGKNTLCAVNVLISNKIKLWN